MGNAIKGAFDFRLNKTNTSSIYTVPNVDQSVSIVGGKGMVIAERIYI